MKGVTVSHSGLSSKNEIACSVNRYEDIEKVVEDATKQKLNNNSDYYRIVYARFDERV